MLADDWDILRTSALTSWKDLVARNHRSFCKMRMAWGVGAWPCRAGPRSSHRAWMVALSKWNQWRQVLPIRWRVLMQACYLSGMVPPLLRQCYPDIQHR